jgi:hypothetical protein
MHNTSLQMSGSNGSPTIKRGGQTDPEGGIPDTRAQAVCLPKYDNQITDSPAITMTDIVEIECANLLISSSSMLERDHCLEYLPLSLSFPLLFITFIHTPIHYLYLPMQ